MDDLPKHPREEGKIEMTQPSEQMLLVQIPKSEIFDETPDDADASKGGERKSISHWFKRHVVTAPGKDTVPIRMTKSEFIAYFAKDEKTGDYKKGVVEPPGGRKAWLQSRLPENDPEAWDLRLRESRMLSSTRGTGYLAMGGIYS